MDKTGFPIRIAAMFLTGLAGVAALLWVPVMAYRNPAKSAGETRTEPPPTKPRIETKSQPLAAQETAQQAKTEAPSAATQPPQPALEVTFVEAEIRQFGKQWFTVGDEIMSAPDFLSFVNFLVRNNSDYYTVPQINIVLLNFWGRKTHDVTLDVGPLPPRTSRRISASAKGLDTAYVDWNPVSDSQSVLVRLVEDHPDHIPFRIVKIPHNPRGKAK